MDSFARKDPQQGAFQPFVDYGRVSKIATPRVEVVIINGRLCIR